MDAIGYDTDSGLMVEGVIATLELNLKVVIKPIPLANRSLKENFPTHDVFAHPLYDGDLVKIGAAWVKDITRGELAGSPMLSVEVSEPYIERMTGLEVYRFSAFPREALTEKGSSYVFQVERPRQRQERAARQANNGSDAY